MLLNNNRLESTMHGVFLLYKSYICIGKFSAKENTNILTVGLVFATICWLDVWRNFLLVHKTVNAKERSFNISVCRVVVGK